MIKDWDFGFYGKGIDGYVHYSLAMDRIREEKNGARQSVMILTERLKSAG